MNNASQKNAGLSKEVGTHENHPLLYDLSWLLRWDILPIRYNRSQNQLLTPTNKAT